MTKKRDQRQEGMATKSSSNVVVVARKDKYKVYVNTKRDRQLL